MNAIPQPRPLFPTDVVTWITDAHRAPGGRNWKPGKAKEQPAEGVQFKSLRVVSRRTVRHGCRESMEAMMKRLGRRRRHGQTAQGATFGFRWAQQREKARPVVAQ